MKEETVQEDENPCDTMFKKMAAANTKGAKGKGKGTAKATAEAKGTPKVMKTPSVMKKPSKAEVGGKGDLKAKMTTLPVCPGTGHLCPVHYKGATVYNNMKNRVWICISAKQKKRISYAYGTHLRTPDETWELVCKTLREVAA